MKFLILILLFGMMGCGTINVTLQTGVPYSGSISDVVHIIHPTFSLLEWLLIKPLYCLDLFFTLIGDTVFLPFMILP